MIGIIGAMASEVDGLKAELKRIQTKTIGNCEFYSGELYGKCVVVAQSGVGKVNAALCAQNMIAAYAPKLIINTGCAAGIGDGIQVGDIVLAHSAVQHDLDYGSLGNERGYIFGVDKIYLPADEATTMRIAAIAEGLGIHTRIGIIATGDQFLSERAKKEDIKQQFLADAVEMEGGAIAHAAYTNHTPFVILRSISDNGDEQAHVSFERFAEEVNQKNKQIIKAFLEGEQ